MKKKLFCICLSLALCLCSLLAACDTDPAGEGTDTQEYPSKTAGNPLSDVTAATLPTTDTAEGTESAETEPVDTVTLLSPEYATDGYTVSLVDGVCYLNFKDGNDPAPSESGDGTLDYVMVGMQFDTYAELRSTLLEGKLTAGQSASMKATFDRNEHGIEILDLVNQGEPTLPAECVRYGKVEWSGNQCAFYLECPTYEGNGFFFMHTASKQASMFESHYRPSNRTVHSETADTFYGVPCTVYHTTNTAGTPFLDVEIEVEQGGTVYRIRISYNMDENDENGNRHFTELDPGLIDVFIEENGYYYMLFVYDFTSTPTLEWLTSFKGNIGQTAESEPAA